MRDARRFTPPESPARSAMKNFGGKDSSIRPGPSLWPKPSAVHEDGEPLEASDDHERFRARSKSPWRAEVQGFNLHAGVALRAGDRAALERLCRYGARPGKRAPGLGWSRCGRITGAPA